MKTLRNQFLDALKEVYSTNIEQVRLQDLLIEYANKPELITLVKERVAKGYFRPDDNAQDFVYKCADEIFFKRLQRKARKEGQDIHSRMKDLHPLWGEPRWTK